MILERFYDDKLAQASYLIGCAASGEAVVVDANRDVSQYVEAAEAEGLRITHVTETHIHADYVSGSRELAERTGARLYLSDEGGADWKYGFAAHAGAVLLRDGDAFEVGNIRIEAMHTPGHTPEHLTFIVTDGAAADRPLGALTGDFLFVGDVGRPDLLEKAAGVRGTMEAGARDLFRSLKRFRAALPEWIQIWPGHGAGSACGKGIGSVPQSTLGYEARFNWALAIDDEDEFVRAVLAGQPEPPRYFAEMKRINRDGPAVLGEATAPAPLPAQRVRSLLRAGEPVVDIRSAEAFAAGHIPGTINIPLNRSFTTWAGWLIPYDRRFYLVADGPEVTEAVRDLAMIGLDRVGGVAGPEVLAWWRSAEEPLAGIERLAAKDVREALRQDGAVLDIRGVAEHEAGRIPGAVNIPLGYLRERLHELPAERPLYVHCESGSRSPVAASVLRAEGVEGVVDFTDGIRGWIEAGAPVESGPGTGEADPSGREAAMGVGA